MESHKCLNCNNDTENNFCSVCGQKNSTHRFSLKNFILHDFIHGILHVDKGIVYTIKELFTRPGHSIREYVQGKRVKDFNYFTLLVIILSATHFVTKYGVELGFASVEFIAYSKVAEKYGVITSLSYTPFYAMASYILFKKSNQNYLEHLVLTIYLTNGMLIIHFVYIFTKVFILSLIAANYFHILIEVIKIIYFFWVYYQYFSGFSYTRKDLIIRCMVLVILIIFITLFINEIINEIGLLL